MEFKTKNMFYKMGKERVKVGADRGSLEQQWLDRVALIFVEGIDRDCDDMTIWSTLNMYDSIVDIFIPKKEGVGRGFAFVRFKHEKETTHLINLNQELVISRRRVSLVWASKPPRPVSPLERSVLKGKHKLSSPGLSHSQVQVQSSGSYKDTLFGLTSFELVGKAGPRVKHYFSRKKSIKFPYVERGTREWMD